MILKIIVIIVPLLSILTWIISRECGWKEAIKGVLLSTGAAILIIGWIIFCDNIFL